MNLECRRPIVLNAPWITRASHVAHRRYTSHTLRTSPQAFESPVSYDRQLMGQAPALATAGVAPSGRRAVVRPVALPEAGLKFDDIARCEQAKDHVRAARDVPP